MREADADDSRSVSFAEIVTVMHKLKKDPSTSTAFVRKIHKAPAQVRGRSTIMGFVYSGGDGCDKGDERGGRRVISFS